MRMTISPVAKVLSQPFDFLGCSGAMGSKLGGSMGFLGASGSSLVGSSDSGVSMVDSNEGKVAKLPCVVETITHDKSIRTFKASKVNRISPTKLLHTISDILLEYDVHKS